MKVYSNYCRRDKCCICSREGQCLYVSGDHFILTNKETINYRLTRLIGRYRVQDISLMRFVLDKMEQEERETKEKEMMAVSIKTVDVEKEKEAAREEGYKQGLEEAWEIARKIIGDTKHLDEYTSIELDRIFGTDRRSRDHLLEDFPSIHEVKEKIAAYEAEQAKPKLGDVVKINFLPKYDTEEIGVYIYERNGYIRILKHTCTTVLQTIDIDKIIIQSIKKTGKHFDIQSMLDEIKE